jgi:hypothetical protein
MSSITTLMIILEIIRKAHEMGIDKDNSGLLLICILQILVILFLVMKIDFSKDEG